MKEGLLVLTFMFLFSVCSSFCRGKGGGVDIPTR